MKNYIINAEDIDKALDLITTSNLATKRIEVLLKALDGELYEQPNDEPLAFTNAIANELKEVRSKLLEAEETLLAPVSKNLNETKEN